MPKLLISILAIFAISVGLLQLRQQRLNYRTEINKLHDKIESSQAKLWNQQLKIADKTTPEAMARRVRLNGQALPEGDVTTAPANGSGLSSAPAAHTGGSVDRRWLDSRVKP